MGNTNLLRCGAVIGILMASGCEGSGTEPMEFRPAPFNPAGSWEAPVSGLLGSSLVENTMVVTLNVFLDHTSTGGPVELSGTWSWSGLAGIIDGFWHAQEDMGARASGNCPDFFTACSLTLSLRQPPDSCAELVNPGVNTIDLLGWFDGSTTMVGASVEGTYWEGTGNETQPCTGPVLVSLDTSASFTRR